MAAWYGRCKRRLLFINDIAGKLCDVSSSPITLPDGAKLNCSMYADDIEYFKGHSTVYNDKRIT